jgi:hypothetical protein
MLLNVGEGLDVEVATFHPRPHNAGRWIDFAAGTTDRAKRSSFGHRQRTAMPGWYELLTNTASCFGATRVRDACEPRAMSSCLRLACMVTC